MPSEKLTAILISRTDMTREEISQIDEADGWRLVYQLDRQSRPERPPEVCFTGFGKSDRERLTELAVSSGFLVKDVVTLGLVLLVTGENAGPSKIRKAQLQNCPVTDEAGFLEYIQGQQKVSGFDEKLEIVATEKDVARLRELLLEGQASPLGEKPLDAAYFERIRQRIRSRE